MTDFDLDVFFENHQPKSLTKYLSPYLNHRKLKNYKLLENNKTSLIPTKTYIKYIVIDDASEGKFRSSHIKAGGILIAGGKYANNKFVESDNPIEWKILKLKFDPSPSLDEKGRPVKREPRIFYISMSKYYIFYKNFDNGLRDFLRGQREKIDVQLLDSKGRRSK